ncbi:MAG: hypothetical protein GY742_22515, partial [Hyphomicrobiales bacterium]|nr:hypothetical protein [Hyphomicrobiales bacterium]
MATVNLLLPHFDRADATSTHTANAREVLRAAGHDCDIYVDTHHADRAGQCRSYKALATGPDDVLVYQFAIGSVLGDWVKTRSERLVVNYHNITPVEFFAQWEPDFTYAATWGRRQLAELAPQAALGLGVSAFNELELVGLGYGVTGVAPVLVDVAGLGGVVDEGAVERFEGWAGG